VTPRISPKLSKIGQGDEVGLRRLGVNLTSDPNFPSKDLLFT